MNAAVRQTFTSQPGHASASLLWAALLEAGVLRAFCGALAIRSERG
ncbi:hypothetical protein [Streptacidiphilus neutrinimicus]|nr:hypothetical protein [Streptacidiphilus neutrinimicus]